MAFGLIEQHASLSSGRTCGLSRRLAQHAHGETVLTTCMPAVQALALRPQQENVHVDEEHDAQGVEVDVETLKDKGESNVRIMLLERTASREQVAFEYPVFLLKSACEIPPPHPAPRSQGEIESTPSVAVRRRHFTQK